MKENKYDFIHEFKDVDFIIKDSFLVKNEWLRICEKVQLSKKIMQPARVGSKAHYVQEPNIRGDNISWIDPQNIAEEFLTLMNELNEIKSILNRDYFLGLKYFETHLAYYAPGSFYQKHIDAHKDGSSRKVTFIYYCNKNWQKGDGGELAMNFENDQKIIEPIGNRLVLFLSDKIQHEVLKSNKDRFSITGWFHDQ